MCAAIIPAISSCKDDSSDNTDPDESTKIGAPTVSVTEGAEVSTDMNMIVLTYAKPVTLNPSVSITLNGTAVSATLNAQDRCIVEVSVSLSAGQGYTLNVPERAVAVVGTPWFAPEVTVNFSTAAIPAPVFDGLVNPSATTAAVKVHKFLVEQNGKHILSGAMSNVSNNNDFADWIYSMTAQYPALTCYDFVHLYASASGSWIDYDDISAATAQWNNNGLVAFMWHWNVPTDEQAYRDHAVNRYGFYSDDTNFSIGRALQEGTWEHECILADIDRVSAIFNKYAEAGIPVIWRPLHEAAGSHKYNNPWFWWGREGTEKTIALWKLMYDRMVNVNGVNNLIWVWTAQYEKGFEVPMKAAYPGNDVVDMVGVDIYDNIDGVQADAYAALLAMTDGRKLVALSENGRFPTPDLTAAPWAYFMEWYTYNAHVDKPSVDSFGNSAAEYKAIFDNPFVMNRESMPSLK